MILMDTIMSNDIMTTPEEVALYIALSVKDKRLTLNLSQQSLAQRSGVSWGVIKKFERTGKISLASLLKLALILECLNEFVEIFKQTPSTVLPTLNALLKQGSRKRGRK